MKKRLSKILFVTFCTLLVPVLLVIASLICTVKLLHPGRLTPLVQELANNTLLARVEVKHVGLSFEPAFPVLKLQVDSLIVISKVFDDLPAQERATLPQWTDTLLTLDRLKGSVNVAQLLKGKVVVHDVELIRPGVNIVLDANGRGNFAIYQSADTTTAAAPDSVSTPLVIPPCTVDHFAFVDPREIRYFSVADSTSATVLLLRDMSLNSEHSAYSLQIDGHLNSPVTQALVNLRDISFGLNGRVRWEPSKPTLLTLEQFRMRGAFLAATVDLGVDLDSTLTITAAALKLDPVKVSDMLTVLPDSVRRANRLVAPYFETDAAIALEARLTKPFCPATDSIPYAQANISMADCAVKYGKAVFKNATFDIAAFARGNDIDSASVDIRKLSLSGPATTVDVSGTVTNLMSDPVFDALVKCNTDVSRLPDIVANLARGYISGRIDLDVRAAGALSMFKEENFHRLDIRGRLSGNKLYYLSNDTSKMVETGKLAVRFGSQIKAEPDSAMAPGTRMLAASIALDTITALAGGVTITASDFTLGAGVENMVPGADTTLVVPVGGRLTLGRFNVESVTDSGGMRARNIDGRVSLRRFRGESRVPELAAHLDIARIAAGVSNTRFILSRAHVEASMHKLPSRRRLPEQLKRTVDSIRHVHPDLAPDSVLRLAVEKRRGHHGKKRVTTTLNNEDLEVLDWELSNGFKKFLLGWQLDGTLSTRSARLFTPMFPLRNRVSRLDLAFTNDSVQLNNLRYTAGRSDLRITGRISNIRRALTSKRAGNSLKINFDINSDTIDVNQLTSAVFAGAAYRKRLEEGRVGHTLAFEGSEDELERELDAIATESPDSVGPLLIPVNIDGRMSLKANNVMYADLAMTGLDGEVLLFDGGVNLHNLAASSDAGGVKLSALYSAPKADDMHFGFGLDLERINVERFLRLVPAVDSMLPIMRDFSGILDAEIAATVDIDSSMNLVLPSLDAAVRLTADSLAFINPKTYATLGRWLRFRDRADNTIKHVNVEMIVRDDMLRIFPFAFNIDRYRLALAGYNDLDLNFNYHIAVLKSPLPFKFGINISGNPDKFKVRFGGAKYKEGEVAASVNVVDTARINLLDQIENVFKRGVRNARFAPLQGTDTKMPEPELPDTGLSQADSLALIKEGLIEAPAIEETPADDK